MQTKTIFASILLAAASVQANQINERQINIDGIVSDVVGAASDVATVVQGIASDIPGVVSNVAGFVSTAVGPEATSFLNVIKSDFSEGVAKASTFAEGLKSKATAIASDVGAAASDVGAAATDIGNDINGTPTGTPTGSAAAASGTGAANMNKIGTSIVVAGAGVVGLFVAL